MTQSYRYRNCNYRANEMMGVHMLHGRALVGRDTVPPGGASRTGSTKEHELCESDLGGLRRDFHDGKVTHAHEEFESNCFTGCESQRSIISKITFYFNPKL